MSVMELSNRGKRGYICSIIKSYMSCSCRKSKYLHINTTKKYWNHNEISTFLGADGGTWTLTPLRALAPEASASAIPPHLHIWFELVRVTGLEPAHLTVPEPKSGASANSAIPALFSRVANIIISHDPSFVQRKYKNLKKFFYNASHRLFKQKNNFARHGAKLPEKKRKEVIWARKCRPSTAPGHCGVPGCLFYWLPLLY